MLYLSKVDLFFYECWEIVDETKGTRAIIWDFLYKKDFEMSDLITEVYELFDYETWELLWKNELEELYRVYNSQFN